MHTPRRRVHLTHGVALWLCATHASEAYLARERGTRFATRVADVLDAAGLLTTRRRAALRQHVLRCTRQAPVSGLPGSYSWPRLRAEAERRWARGDAPESVIAELRGRHAGDVARAPSVRTMRRWFSQARWCARPVRGAAPRSGHRRVSLSRYQRFVRLFGDPPDRLWRQALYPWLEGYVPTPLLR